MSVKATATLKRRGQQISKANRLNRSEQRKLENNWTTLEKNYKARISKADHYSNIIHNQLKDYEKETIGYYNDCKPYDGVYWKEMPGDEYPRDQGDIPKVQKHKQEKVPIHGKPLSPIICEARLALSNLHKPHRDLTKKLKKRRFGTTTAPIIQSKLGRQKTEESDFIQITEGQTQSVRSMSSEDILDTDNIDNDSIEIIHKTNNDDRDQTVHTIQEHKYMAPHSRTNNLGKAGKTRNQSETSRPYTENPRNYEAEGTDVSMEDNKNVLKENIKLDELKLANHSTKNGRGKGTRGTPNSSPKHATIDALKANASKNDSTHQKSSTHSPKSGDHFGSNVNKIKDNSRGSVNIPNMALTDKHFPNETSILESTNLAKSANTLNSSEGFDKNNISHKAFATQKSAVGRDTQQNSEDITHTEGDSSIEDNIQQYETYTAKKNAVETDSKPNDADVIQSEINEAIHTDTATKKFQHDDKRPIRSLNTITEKDTNNNGTNKPTTTENKSGNAPKTGKWKAILQKRGLTDLKQKPIILTETGDLVHDDDDTSYKQTMANKWKSVTWSKLMKSNQNPEALNASTANGLTLPKLGALGHGRRPSFARLASTHDEPNFEDDDIAMLQIKSLKF